MECARVETKRSERCELEALSARNKYDAYARKAFDLLQGEAASSFADERNPLVRSAQPFLNAPWHHARTHASLSLSRHTHTRSAETCVRCLLPTQKGGGEK